MKTNKTIVAPAQSVESPSRAQTSHTPTPWFVWPTSNGYSIQARGDVLALTHDWRDASSEENAQLIVRAVNSHSALLDACKAILFLARGEVSTSHQNQICNIADAAIAEAEGKS